MKKIKKLYDNHAYQILLTFLPTIAGMLILNNEIHLSINEYVLAAIILMWILVIRALDCNKSFIVVRILMLGLVVMLVVVAVYNIDQLVVLKNKLQMITSEKIPSSELNVFELLLINCSLILACSLPLYIIQKFKPSKLAFGSLLLVFLVVMATQEGMYHLYAISFAWIYVFLVFAEVLIARFIPYRKIDSSRVMVHLAPLVLVYIIMVTYLPVSEKPVTLHETIATGIKDTVTGWYDQIRYMLSTNKGEYGLDMMGYSEEAGFEGIAGANDTVCLDIFSTRPLGQPIYLRGTWKNVYTGSGWREDVGKTDSYYLFGEDMLDWNEFLYSLYRYNGLKNMDSLMRIDNVDITYKDIETSSIFLPSKCTNIKGDMGLDLQTPENVNYGELRGSGNKYNFSVIKANYNSPEWEKFVNAVQNYTYTNDNSVDLGPYRKAVRENMISIGLHGDMASEDNFAKRAAYIKEEFTQLPDSLPDRVRELTKQITQGCNTPIEQCKAIEKYLKSYTYTLHPQKMPEGQDLVDWLLFETKEGYCTNYATAMAVMVRTLGLPSRYDQGFVVKTKENPNSHCDGKSGDAHAWVEVYIEGLGWMTYDPTPKVGNGLSVDYQWDSKVVAEDPNKSNDSGSEVLLDMFEISKYYEIMANENRIALNEAAQNNQLLSFMLYLMVALVILGILVTIGYIIIRIMRNKTAWKKLDANRKLHVTMIQIFSLLDAFGLPIEDSETLLQYCTRVKRALEEESLSITAIEPIYSAVRYSNKEASLSELDQVIKFKDKLLLVLKKNRKLFSYCRIWLKYSMMVIK